MVISHDWLIILGLFGIEAANIKLGPKDDVILLMNLWTWNGHITHNTDDTKVMKMTRADKRLLRNMHAWVIWGKTTFPGINYSTLNIGNFDTYLMLRSMTPVTPALPALATALQI